MILFNVDALVGKTNKLPDDASYADEILTGLRKLINWCNARALKVYSDGSIKSAAQYFEYDKQIVVSSRFSAEKQLFLMLHECGHFLAMAYAKKSVRAREYARVRANSRIDTRVHCSTSVLRKKIELIEEEFEAWRRGEQLAQKLDICLNIDAFDRCKGTMLRSYFKDA